MITLTMLAVMMTLGLLRALCARRRVEPAIARDKDMHAESCVKDAKACVNYANAYVKHADAYMSGVELVWTERGERLHMSRDCVSLRNSTKLRSKSTRRLCARDHK